MLPSRVLTERGNPSGESSDGAANAVDTGGKNQRCEEVVNSR